MKLAIVGLPQSGRSTLFAALTGARGLGNDAGHARTDERIAAVSVLDERVTFLSEAFHPQKTTYAKIEYLLPAEIPGGAGRSDASLWNQVRTCDALLHNVRNFVSAMGDPPAPQADLRMLEEEMILNDLAVTEKRLERMELDLKRGRKPDGDEYPLLQACKELLDQGLPLRQNPDLATAPSLRGFTFLSAKPVLVIINNDDEDEAVPDGAAGLNGLDCLVVRGRLEKDIAGMTPEEAEEFQEAYHIHESALDRVIRGSFALLRRISFFTVGEDEVRAWPIVAGTSAVDAAGEVHTDIRKGFIRAEVFTYEDFKTHGNVHELKKAGLIRLEGKEYTVKDGDIVHFRFNV